MRKLIYLSQISNFRINYFNCILSSIYTKYMLASKKRKREKISRENSAFKISKIFKHLYFIYIQYIRS